MSNLSVDAAEGVLQAEKDFNLASHPEIEGIPNLQVQTTIRSCSILHNAHSPGNVLLLRCLCSCDVLPLETVIVRALLQAL